MTENNTATNPTGPEIRVTKPFRTVSGDYFSVLLGAWMPRYGWLMLLPVAFFVALGYMLQDERWLITALILTFIVAPMVMSFLYTYYMLTPEARRTILNKRVEIAEGKYIRLTYLPSESRTSGGNEAGTAGDATNDRDTNNPGPGTAETVPQPETIYWNEIAKIKYTSRYCVYFIKGEKMQFLLIPWNAFPNHNQRGNAQTA